MPLHQATVEKIASAEAPLQVLLQHVDSCITKSGLEVEAPQIAKNFQSYMYQLIQLLVQHANVPAEELTKLLIPLTSAIASAKNPAAFQEITILRKYACHDAIIDTLTNLHAICQHPGVMQLMARIQAKFAVVCLSATNAAEAMLHTQKTLLQFQQSIKKVHQNAPDQKLQSAIEQLMDAALKQRTMTAAFCEKYKIRNS